MEQLHGLASVATKHLLADLCRELARDQVLDVHFDAEGGPDVAQRVRAGAEADVLVLSEAAVTDLENDGFLVPGTVRPMFISEVVAAQSEAATPIPLESEADLRAALEGATRLAYSTGPSGAALLDLLDRWELTTRLEGRLVRARPGVPVGLQIANGEADLGFQQRSELQSIEGVRVIGPLPGGARLRSTFSGGVLASSERRESASSVLALLVDPGHASVVLGHGMSLAGQETVL